MDNGYIKLYRQINGSELSIKPVEWRWIWVQILLDTNYEDNGIYTKGKMITKYDDFAKKCGVRTTQVRGCIDWLRGESMIQTRQLTRGVEITVNNWDKYQGQNESIAQPKGKQNESILHAINKGRRKEEKNNSLTLNHSSIEEEREMEIPKGNIAVNEVCHEIRTFCKEHQIIYDQTDERRFAKHISSAKEFGEIAEQFHKSRIELALFIVQIAEQDEFWRGKVCGPKAIYQQRAKILNSARADYISRIQNPDVLTC